MARNVAKELPHIGLGDGLELTPLAIDRKPTDFEPMARRLLERLLTETLLELVALTAQDLQKAANCPIIERKEAVRHLRETLGRA
jgi:hypothetical protein